MPAATPDNLETLVGSTLGPYRLEKLLGRGGMGAVFAAVHQQTGWKRALKLIRPELAVLESFRKRFLDEAKALDALNHPNILRVYELGEHQSHLYLVTELLDGESASARLSAAQGPLPLADVLGWFDQALLGVAEAHQRGILHRDLKPENLFLLRQGGVKVLDFGIAKAADEAARATGTQDGRVPGSPPYMAPEVVEGKLPSARSDLYSMGISLYEMLTGQHPFGAKGSQTTGSAIQIMYAHVHTPMPDARAQRPDLSPAICEVILTACAKKPEERYEGAEQLRLALKAAASGAPQPARRSFTELSLTPFSVTPPAGAPGKGADRRRSKAIWIVVPAVLLLGAGGALVAMKRSGPSPADGGQAALVPLFPTTPAEDPRLALNKWIRVPRPSGKVELGVPEKVAETEHALMRGVDFFSGPEFDIQQHEVTWQEYALWSDPERKPSPPADPSLQRRPAVGVPFKSAVRYCESLGGKLPTEAEFEYAARGAELRANPWGNDPIDLERTHAFAGPGGQARDVMSNDQDVTPDTRIFDLAGNAAEWTQTKYRLSSGDAPPWAANLRAVRGLPLRLANPEVLPRYAGAFRWRGCELGDGCKPEEQEAIQEVGFRCVKRPEH